MLAILADKDKAIGFHVANRAFLQSDRRVCHASYIRVIGKLLFKLGHKLVLAEVSLGGRLLGDLELSLSVVKARRLAKLGLYVKSFARAVSGFIQRNFIL